MYKLLIVDDNPHDRRGIEKICRESSLEIEVIGTCSNGSKAIDFINSIEPDIILTDIAMPIMDGIQMAKILRSTHPHIKILFMSCHRDFDFARSAMNLDVNVYVLKPIVREELIRSLQKAIENNDSNQILKMEKEEMLRQLAGLKPVLKEKFFRELLFGGPVNENEIMDRIAFLGIDIFDNCIFQVFTFSLKDFNGQDKLRTDDQYALMYTIEKLVNAFTDNNYVFNVIQTSVLEFTVIVFINNNLPDNRTALPDIIFSVKERLETAFRLSITIGVSKSAKSPLKIHELYRQAVNALNTVLYSDNADIVLYEEIEDLQTVVFEERVNLQQLYGEIKNILHSKDDNIIFQFIQQYLGGAKEIQSESYVKSFTYSTVNILQILLMEVGKTIDDVTGEKLAVWQKLSRFDSIKDICRWIFNIMLLVKQNFNDNSAQGYANLVEKMKEYIHKHYSEHLTLNIIAKEINYSPCHCNNLFKSLTGKTVFDYIIVYRMEKAKQLLSDPYSKIYQVSEQVGYTNKSHFSEQFSRYTGMSPLDYKNGVTATHNCP